MFEDFIFNASLLIASIYIMGQIFKDRPLEHSSSISTKLYWGLCYGALGIVLMIFSIKINATVIADLRHLAIIIPAAFGGFLPAFITGLIIAVGRLLLLGISETSLIAASGALLIAIACGHFSKFPFNTTLKAFFMNVIGLIITSIILFIIINDPVVLNDILIIQYPISLIGGLLAYHFSVFIANSNESQRQLQLSLIKLKETEERFRLLAEYSSDMITMHGEMGEYKYISPAVKEILQFEYQDLLGKRIADFIHPDDLKGTEEMFDVALSEGFADYTYRYRAKHGAYVWMESTFKSVPYQGENSKRIINVSRNITERKMTEEKLQKANELLNRLSYMDGLTGAGNRRYFDVTLNKEWEKLSSAKSPLTLLMFDIDYFKKFNDTYGHLAGDHCLKAIADAIKNLKSTGTNFKFCRYGGEEFAIILPSTDINEGKNFAGRIQETIHSLEIPHIGSEISNTVTISIGIATIVPNTEINSKKLIQLADMALYASKKNGRNRISIST
ncbi:diguanylate cyclase [Neobacillus sp. FSL H8-0543]|uniref:diguanylate cyclase domain-containing protein n=1 Tax=Neobacillus sp. FSL H8-0543 TaxID=2954672 RepID=UPI0031598BA3